MVISLSSKPKPSSNANIESESAAPVQKTERKPVVWPAIKSIGRGIGKAYHADFPYARRIKEAVTLDFKSPTKIPNVRHSLRKKNREFKGYFRDQWGTDGVPEMAWFFGTNTLLRAVKQLVYPARALWKVVEIGGPLYLTYKYVAPVVDNISPQFLNYFNPLVNVMNEYLFWKAEKIPSEAANLHNAQITAVLATGVMASIFAIKFYLRGAEIFASKPADYGDHIGKKMRIILKENKKEVDGVLIGIDGATLKMEPLEGPIQNISWGSIKSLKELRR